MREKGKIKQNDGRITSLDILRVTATCAVVLMHTVTGVMTAEYDFTGWERRYQAFLVIVDATAWSVPVFLILSGYLFLDPDRRITWREMLGRYCRRVLLALILFGVPYSFLEIFAAERIFRPAMLWQAVKNTALGHSWAHMWYLYLILILYAATPLLKWLLEKLPAPVWYALVIVLLLCSSLIPFWTDQSLGAPALPGEGIYLFYYLCGYLFARGKKKRSVRAGRVCLALFCLLAAAQAALRLGGAEIPDLAYSHPVTAAQAVLLFAGMRGLAGHSPKKETKILVFAKRRGGGKRLWRELSGLCFGVYLIHPVFLNFFYKFLGISVMDFRFWIGVPLFFGIALFGAAAVTWLLRKIPVLRRYVL